MNSKAPSSSKLRVVYLAPAQTNTVGGVRRFDAELQRAMKGIAELTVIETLPREGSSWRKMPAIGTAFGKLLMLRRARRAVRDMERQDKVDVVFHSFHWPPKLSKSIPSIGFIHDLRMVGAHERQQPRWGSFRIRLVKHAIKSWDVVCVPSQHVADDVTFLIPWVLPEVVREGLDHLPHSKSGVKDRVLIVTGVAPHKRSELAKEIAVHVHDEFGLPVTVLGLENGLWIGDRDIATIHQVGDQELAEALSHGLVCVATTAYEGFGLAVGEAMRAGCPIVFGSDSALDFLVGDSGFRVEPTLMGFTAGLAMALENIETLRLKSAQRALEFLWIDTAEKILYPGGRARPRNDQGSCETLKAKGFTRLKDDSSLQWSVIIPTFNRCEEISRAIDSVLSQDLNDYELLVVDDASTDRTLEMLATYNEPRIRVFRHPENRGAAEARNTGIQNSSGTFVAFLDSDDYWKKDKLSTLQAELLSSFRLKRKIDIICHSSEVLTKMGSKTSPLQASLGQSLRSRLLSGEFIQTSGVAVRRSLAELVLFDQSVTPYEDWDFLFRCEEYVEPDNVLIIPAPLSVHDARNQSGRLSRDSRARTAGARLMYRNLMEWTRSERASFSILRQLHTERALRSKRNLFVELLKQVKTINSKTSRHWVSAVNCVSPTALSLAQRCLRAGGTLRRRSRVQLLSSAREQLLNFKGRES